MSTRPLPSVLALLLLAALAAGCSENNLRALQPTFEISRSEDFETNPSSLSRF